MKRTNTQTGLQKIAAIEFQKRALYFMTLTFDQSNLI